MIAPKRPQLWRPLKRQVLTIIAGFQCQDGIVVCADTQETVGSAKRNVPKLEFYKGPVCSSQDSNKLVNHDLALVICGAGDGPFVDKIASRAWDAVREVSDAWEASDAVESMIKETYKEFGEIYQTGACPQAELIYGITIGGHRRLFHAVGPVVNERSYASSGIGYYLADFLTARMRGDAWLTVRQSIILAAYILFQAKEHVEGCGGESHIAVLRDEESSGRVDFHLINHLTAYLKSADHYTGEMLLTAADFSISDSEFSQRITDSTEMLKFIRDREIKELGDDREFSRHLFAPLINILNEREDDLGLPIKAKPSTPETSEDQR